MTSTQTAEAKDLARRWIQCLNERDFDGAIRLCADDLVNHAAIPEAQGAAGMRRILDTLVAAMPDLRWSCEDMIAEDDRVVCRVSLKGTQTGALDFTRVQLPASGRSCATEQLHMMRVQNGRIVEHWAGRDDFGMMRQLGHFPFAGAKA